ncbi:hypothetical protein GCM10009798_37210 [Nocardioides panacihumi]|uniref:F-box domain-containing protein n=2 Tax=Nocardioides panacihumi TaxID=400774 RepID=A0ABP5D291_9ACTN
MKSGTTSLQELLFANRPALQSQGLLVPGHTWGDQARAVTEVARTARVTGALWSALRDEIAAHDGPAVVSMEYLAPLPPALVAAVVASLGDTRVEVVLTVRDLNRTLVSMWQETIQNGRSWTWADYLDGARRARPRRRVPRVVPEAGRTFWKQQDVVGLVRTWGAAAGPGSVSVVTVPPPGAPRDELAARFGRAVGFSSDGLLSGESANASLGLTSAVLLQRVNAELADRGVSLDAGKRLRKRVLAKQILAARAATEPRIGLPVERWVRSYAAGTVRRLAAEVPRLEGSWADLTPVDVPGSVPATVDDTALTDTAGRAFAELRTVLAERGVTPPEEWPVGASGDRAVAALAGLVAAGVRAGVTA